MSGIVALALAIALAGCEDEVAPPFEIEGTGGIQGFIFFDANEDGHFDPADGDYAVPGVAVRVLERGTGQVLAGAQATTGSEGRFEITDLPPGTHDLEIVEATVPEEVSICRNPVPVTVYLGEPADAIVAGRPGCLVLIAEAIAEPSGSFVIVRGIVTSFPGQMRSAYTYIEDASTGIRIFDGSLEGQGIEIGDQLEVGGTVSIFNNDLQLSGVNIRELIKDVTTPVPLETTTGEIAAAGPNAADPLQGRLVVVRAAELTRGFTTGGSRNALIDDGSGTTELRIEGGVVSGTGDAITSLFTIGACYDITGAVGNFQGVAQLFPRSLDDLEEVPCN